MTDPLLNQLGNLIGGSFSLSQEAFRRIVSLSEGQTIALLVVLAAGLSLAVNAVCTRWLSSQQYRKLLRT